MRRRLMLAFVGLVAGVLVIAGAGSIGCFVGGMCAAAGHHVALLARPRVIQEIESNGLNLTSFEGAERNVDDGLLLPARRRETGTQCEAKRQCHEWPAGKN